MHTLYETKNYVHKFTKTQTHVHKLCKIKKHKIVCTHYMETKFMFVSCVFTKCYEVKY